MLPLPRSNEVSVDGVDTLDNSVNGIRATVSQEAVQEFQIIQSNYMPEFGRATGGVVNIVTKSGSNETHGNLYGMRNFRGRQGCKADVSRYSAGILSHCLKMRSNVW
jgi:outer membrane receptor for ferrienterochelin and colicin